MEDSRSEETRKYIGIHMVTMGTSAIHAAIKEGLDPEEAFNDWLSVCKSGKYVLEHPEATKEEKATAQKHLQDGILGMGKALYELEEYDQVVSLLEGHENDERAGVILGLAYFKVADSKNLAQYISYIKKAFHLVQAVERNQTLDLDSEYRFLAFDRLKNLYVIAEKYPELGITPNVDAAYNCMLAASELPDLNPHAQMYIISELKKFRKGFWGKYIYEN